ncbi:hypothetical protein AVL55_17345 [Alteromonas macleodii]|uniref:AlgX/AlgJ SGNH hydrolase-like domain-containing protein n=1 Tax=Alteromonas macleodii TaxID=28108 RepID=A0A126Q3D9_ALTMA|nr:hypothetical protein [Alteromonas macleodii]AMJ99763.1 hypothetical protein AVL55_17345 [Alteromonas macleodii]
MIIQKLSNNSKESNNIVYEGKDGFLFLAGGAHTPFAYSFGRKAISPESLSAFVNNIKWRTSYTSKRNIPYLHLIAPDKQSVLEDKITLNSGYKEHNGDKVLSVLQPDFSDCVIYPAQLLRATKKSFYKTDTHCTPYGSIAMCEYILLQILNDEEFESSKKKLNHLRESLTFQNEFLGDLGTKLKNTDKELRYALENERSIKFFTNDDKTGNTGICDIYINLAPTPIINKRLLIFGDSFGRDIAHILSRLFQEVLFCRTEFFHPEVIELFRPDFIISQNVERYLASIKSDRARTPFLLQKNNIEVKNSPLFPLALKAVMSYGLKQYDDYMKNLAEKEG